MSASRAEYLHAFPSSGVPPGSGAVRDLLLSCWAFCGVIASALRLPGHEYETTVSAHSIYSQSTGLFG